MNYINELNGLLGKMSKIAEAIGEDAKSRLYNANVNVGDFCGKAMQDVTLKGRSKILIDKSIELDKAVSKLRDNCDKLHPDELPEVKTIKDANDLAVLVFHDVLTGFDRVITIDEKLNHLLNVYTNGTDDDKVAATLDEHANK